MKTITLAAFLAPGLLLAACSKPPTPPPSGSPAARPVAADPRSGPDYRRCIDRAGYVDSEIAACEREELDRRDAALNAAYRAAMARAGTPGERAALIAAEKAWIAYRDAQCAYRGQAVEGGTLQPVIIASCLVDLTVERVRFLETTLESPY